MFDHDIYCCHTLLHVFILITRRVGRLNHKIPIYVKSCFVLHVYFRSRARVAEDRLGVQRQVCGRVNAIVHQLREGLRQLRLVGIHRNVSVQTQAATLCTELRDGKVVRLMHSRRQTRHAFRDSLRGPVRFDGMWRTLINVFRLALLIRFISLSNCLTVRLSTPGPAEEDAATATADAAKGPDEEPPAGRGADKKSPSAWLDRGAVEEGYGANFGLNHSGIWRAELI